MMGAVASPAVASRPPEPVASPVASPAMPVTQVPPPQELPLFSSSYGAGRCCNCNATNPDDCQTFVIDGARYVLHATCKQFWLERHDPRWARKPEPRDWSR
jgi:hypothetical protein